MGSNWSWRWIPAPGRKTVLISPEQQAKLMCQLAVGKVPFSRTSQTVLKDIMTVQKTQHGILYGKTGSGVDSGAELCKTREEIDKVR
jgi:beta-lactamase class D